MCWLWFATIQLNFPVMSGRKKGHKLICNETIHYSDVDMPFEQRKVALAATYLDYH